MDKISLERQVLSTNDWGLLAILNEGLIDKLDESISMIEARDYEGLNQIVNLTRDILTELIVSFRNDNPASKNLRQVYLFINKLITQGENMKDVQSFKDGKKIINPILEAFREREEGELARVVSGLTYGEKDLLDHKLNSTRTFEG